MVIYCCHRNRLFCNHKHSFVSRPHPASCHLSFHSAKQGEVMEGGVIGSEACHYKDLVIAHCTQSQVFGLFYLLCQKWGWWCLSCTQELALLLYWLHLFPPIHISQWFSAGRMWQEILGPGMSAGPLWDGLPPCAGECWPISLASFRGPFEKP